MIPVGMLSCQRDTYLRKLTTKVISIATAKTAPVSSALVTSKEKSAVKPSYWEVVLQDTVLFPEGGGQLTDQGKIGNHPVCFVQRRGNSAIHFIEKESNSNNAQEEKEKEKGKEEEGEKTSAAEPPPFKENEQVECEVDWSRRFDHAQHHSAQHLLTDIVEKELSLPTISWCLAEGDSSPCNIQLQLPSKESSSSASSLMTQAQIDDIEAKCNDLIRKNVPVVTTIFKTREEVPEARSRGLPGDVKENIRLVEIPDIGSCLCCGTHVSSLGELQLVKLLHTEGKGQTVRLFFIAGNRALRYFSSMYSREREMQKFLGTAPADFLDSVSRRSSQLTAAQKSEKKLRAELTQLLIPTITASVASSAASSNSVFLYHREDADDSMVSEIATHLNKAVAAQRVCVVAGGNLKSEVIFSIVGGADGADAKSFAETVFVPALNGGKSGGAKGNFIAKQQVFRGRAEGVSEAWKAFWKKKPTFPA